jgi:peptidoglycan/xylan/chitin deacetylase (PgdA/CDA1 family)
MLNFKQTSNIFILLAIVTLIVCIILEINFAYLLLIAFIYSVLLALGSMNVCSQFYLDVQCISEDKSKIHLTFDDGPNHETTSRILDILKEHNEKAIFFLIGQKILEYPELVKRISDEGHTIGNHSYSHSNLFPLFRTKKVQEELEKTNTFIKEITGKDCTLFRPPFGVTNPNIAKAVNRLDMQTIGWSLRTLDTVADKDIILEKNETSESGRNHSVA